MPKHRANENPSNYLLLAALIGGAGLIYYFSTRKEETKASPLPVRPKPQILDLDLEEEEDIPEMESPIPSEEALDAELVQNVSSWLLRQPGSIVPGLPKPTIDGAEWVDETTVIKSASGRSIEIVRGKDRVVSITSYTDGPIVVYYKPTGEIIRYN